jgi:hypothetical protein
LRRSSAIRSECDEGEEEIDVVDIDVVGENRKFEKGIDIGRVFRCARGIVLVPNLKAEHCEQTERTVKSGTIRETKKLHRDREETIFMLIKIELSLACILEVFG